MPHIRRALISVSDKRGLIEFAKALQRMGVGIISTGATHGALKEHGISADSVSDVTNFPEILDGRVKTLHPKIHAGLLALAITLASSRHTVIASSTFTLRCCPSMAARECMAHMFTRQR